MSDYVSGGKEGRRHARRLKMMNRKNSSNRPAVHVALSIYYLSLICIALGIGVGRLLTHYMICDQYHYTGYVLALLLSFILLLAGLPIVDPNVLS